MCGLIRTGGGLLLAPKSLPDFSECKRKARDGRKQNVGAKVPSFPCLTFIHERRGIPFRAMRLNAYNGVVMKMPGIDLIREAMVITHSKRPGGLGRGYISKIPLGRRCCCGASITNIRSM